MIDPNPNPPQRGFNIEGPYPAPLLLCLPLNPQPPQRRSFEDIEAVGVGGLLAGKRGDEENSAVPRMRSWPPPAPGLQS